ncbi:DUF3519 domain-containing protein [Helicobacter pylori]|uniref:DUF3519 domain-containing protein n=1 Tax=Helicobacter pylori TaxID=210 RepID=UPI0035C774BE
MKLPKALNEATAGAALKYHIKRALERSHSISEFSKNLELSAKNAKFSNNTLKIIEELTNGVKQASEEIKSKATKTSNLVKSIREQDKRPFEVIEDKEAFFKDLNKNLKDNATPLPKGMSIEEFKQSLESVENKDRFLEHLETRDNSQDRLKFLSLIEPILREPHIEIFIKDKDSGIAKKEYIKAFKDENKTRLYMLITQDQDNDTILRTFIPKLNERYMRSHVRDADIIHSFIQPNRTAKSDNTLSDVVVYGENNTPKPLTDQEDLLKNTELENETTPTPTHLSPLEQANAKKLLKLQRATTPLKEFGANYPEFALRPKEALEKLLQEKNGQVAGAAFRDDLGGIDFVWGKDGKDGYGLAHILEKREKQYTRLGLNAEQIKERTDELVKSIPEVIENGTLFKDDLGRVSVELNDIKVGLTNQWYDNDLKNHLIVTSYERDGKVLRELETRSPLSNDYKGNSNYSALNLNEPNPTKESLTSQESNLSILEKSQLEKQKKLESERLAKAEKERAQKIKSREEAELRDKIRAQKNATLGKSELDREIAKSENIPYKELENAPKTSVSLNDDEIHPLKFVIVNKSDLKPNFKNTGTQTRTAVDSKKVEEIAKRFDPKLIIGRGGFDDLPIILRDGQVIAGNHRIQGMLNFNAESRKKYEQALKENFNIRLKPNELLVRMPEQELNDKEIFKLASKSNENRANSFSDTLLSAMSSYSDKLKHLPNRFESDSVENLANQVARVLERDAKIPSANQVENANLSLLGHYARNTPNNSFLEVFDNAYKNLDREQFKAFKEMFANNSANFHNLNNDTTIKNFMISPYLTDALDTTAKMLESGNRSDNFSKLAHDIDYLVNTTDENGMNAFIKENKDAYNSVISQLLGSSFARFLRLENPSAQFYEFLVKAKDQMIENASDIFAGTSKPISQINIFDFIKYGIESGNSSKESRELLDLLPELEKKFNAHEKFLQGSKK